MKLKKFNLSNESALITAVQYMEEARYLTHCMNISRILADKNGWGDVDTRLKRYVQITGAELVDDKSS